MKKHSIIKTLILLLVLVMAACNIRAQQNVGIGTNTPVSKVDINGSIALREGSAISVGNGGSSGGTNDNIVLPTISGTSDVASFYRITGPTAAFSVFGIAPVGGADGQVVTLVNISGQVMTLVNNNSSNATNGILTQTGADLADNAGATANSSITLQYNKTAGKWYVTASQNFTVSSANLATHNIVPGSGSALTVTNGNGQVVGGGDVVVDVATNALNQKGVVAGPTGTNGNQGWITDATGHPGWAAVNSAIVAKDITTSTNGVNLTSNTGQVVGASNMTIDVATNSASSAGLVPSGSGNNNKVWGTDGSGNPSWNSVGNAQLANSSVTINAGTGLSGGGTVALGSSVTLNNAGVTSLTSASPLTTNTSATGNVTVNLTGAVPVGNLPNLAGDVTGAINANTVTAIQGQPVDNTTPTGGQVLEYNSGTSKWTPTSVGSSLFSAGTGLSWSGSTLNNTGVTSVGMSLPSVFSVTGSPVTTTGTLSATLANENANTVFAGPASGSATTPTFRALTAADLPAGGATNYFNFNNATGGTAGWVQLGTLSLPQGGYNAYIEMHAGAGYNATNGQNGYVDLYIRTSNGSSVDANGFAASAFAEKFGFNPFISNIVLVANAAGVSATQYTVYINAAAFIGEGWYSVKTSNGSWVPSSTAATPSGTTGSSTVCVVPFEHIVQNTFSVMNGNAGIGTTTPAYPLDAVGDINSSSGFSIGGTAANASYLRGNGSQFVSSGLLGADITGTVPVGSIPAGNGNYVQINPSSQQSGSYNVSGDGTMGGNLSVGGTSYLGGYITGMAGTNPPNNMIRLTPNLHLNAGQHDAVIFDWDNGNSGTDLNFRIGNGASADIFDVLANGNVGIGTTGPSALLHIAGGGEILGTTGSVANTRTLNIINNGQSAVNFGAYPGAWTGALQIQSNDNSRFLWMSPLDVTSSANSRLMAAGTGFDIYVNGSAGSNGVLSTSFTNGNVFVNGSATIGTYGTITSTAASYGTIALAGAENGYYGLWYGGSACLMYDGSGNGGIYSQNAGFWPQYYLVGSRDMNIGTSTDLGATLGVAGNINSQGNIVNTTPSQGYLGITGDLPGYATGTYPTLLTNGSDLYFSVGGYYSAYVTSGGVRTAVSSRKKKENFETLDKEGILDKIDALEMYKWDYICEKAHAKHIGPIAEDFYGKFGLNECDSMISSIDPAGVALVGVQALSKRVDEIKTTLQAENDQTIVELKNKLEALKRKNALLKIENADMKNSIDGKASAAELDQLKAQLNELIGLKQRIIKDGARSQK